MDPYVDPDSGLLRNRLGITDAHQLAVAEGQLAYHAEIRLYARQTNLPRYDLDALRAVHRYLFEDIYHWAGELRTVEFSKGTTLFARLPFLRPQGRGDVPLAQRPRRAPRTRTRRLRRRSQLPPRQAERTASVREGNGRTQRAFLQLLARRAGYQLAWAHIHPQENLQASQNAMIDDDAFRPLLRRILQPAEPALDLPMLRMLHQQEHPGLDL